MTLHAKLNKVELWIWIDSDVSVAPVLCKKQIAFDTWSCNSFQNRSKFNSLLHTHHMDVANFAMPILFCSEDRASWHQLPIHQCQRRGTHMGSCHSPASSAKFRFRRSGCGKLLNQFQNKNKPSSCTPQSPTMSATKPCFTTLPTSDQFSGKPGKVGHSLKNTWNNKSHLKPAEEPWNHSAAVAPKNCPWVSPKRFISFRYGSEKAIWLATSSCKEQQTQT